MYSGGTSMDVLLRKSSLSDYEIIDKMLCKLHKYHVENKPEVYKEIEHFFSKEEFEKILEENNFFILSILDGVVVGLIWYRGAEKGNKFTLGQWTIKMKDGRKRIFATMNFVPMDGPDIID